MYGKVYQVKENSESELARKLHGNNIYGARHSAELAARRMNRNVITRILREVNKMTGTVRGKNVETFREAISNCVMQHYVVVEITVNR